MAYLDSVNDNFSNAVYRTVGVQSSQLKTVIKAVRDFQTIPNIIQLRALKDALAAWERSKPDEYRSRFLLIKGAFERELSNVESQLHPSSVATLNNMEWVRLRSGLLETFKNYAVEDVLQYKNNAHIAARQDCLARYKDFSSSAPVRLGQPINLGFRHRAETDWNANRARMIYNFMTYAAPRTIRYTPSANPDETPKIGAGTRVVTSLGSGICTQFAYAAAHVLTNGRVGGPTIDVVSWMAGIGMAHCYVVVGREIDGPLHELPRDVDEWGGDIVIVDAWLAALGHKVAYRITNWAGDHPFPNFLTDVEVVMSRDFAPFIFE